VLDGAFLAIAQLDAGLLSSGLVVGFLIPVRVLWFWGFSWRQILPAIVAWVA